MGVGGCICFKEDLFLKYECIELVKCLSYEKV